MVFVLFAINGPAIDLVGQIRLSELAILTVGLLNAARVSRSIGRTEQRLGLLLILSAFTYLFMDAFNQGIDDSTVARFGTYLILCALLFSIKWIIGDSKQRLVAALLGFSLSFVLVLVLDLPVPSANYHTVPWRLGLGAAATLSVCVSMFYFPRRYVLGLIGLAALLAIHVLLNSRNLALITFLVFAVSLWANMFGSLFPRELNAVRKTKFLTIGFAGIFGLYALIQGSMVLSILPDEMQRKFENQLHNIYGLAAAARPDTAAAIYGITKQPITGFGSSTVDPDVYGFYARVAAASFSTVEQQRYQSLLEQEWLLGTPSHSHIFGAWVDAGIIAAVSWMVVLVLCAKILGQIMHYRNAITPLATFVALSLFWDVLFSPGPSRLEVALSIVVLLFVDRHLEWEKQAKRLQLAAASAQKYGVRVR